MKTISLLHGDDFNNNIFEEIRDSKNFVFDYSSSKILQKYGIDSFHADEFLTKLERDEIFDHVVSKLYWFKNEKFLNKFSQNEIQLFQFLDPLYLHQKLLVTLIHFFIIKKIIETEKPKKIFATQNLSKIVSIINSDIPIVLINQEKVEIFDKYDIRFSLLSKVFSIKISMKLLRKLQGSYESVMCTINDFWFKQTGKPIILLLEFDPSKFSDLFQSLKSKDFQCIILNRRKSALINNTSKKILKNSNTKIINFQKSLSNEEKLEISKITNDYKKFLNSFWNDEESLQTVFSFKGTSYYLAIKDFLKQQFESELESNVENLIQSKHMFKNFDVKCILYQYESGTSENITLSQREKTPSLLIKHGFSSFTEKFDDLRWRYDQFRLLKLHCDQIILWGESDFKYYSKFLPNSQLKKIGSPRHDAFFNELKQNDHSLKTILITVPPIIEWTGQQNLNLELRYEKVLRKLINDLKKTSDFKIIGKLHPGWGWKFNQTLIKIFNDIDPNIPVFNSKSIINLINECDIMININPEENQPSTVMLESLIMKKPVINISLDDNYSDSKFDEESSIISLSYSSDIMKYVNALFFDSEFKDRLELKIQNSLKKFLSNHKNASKEIANHLKSFV